MVIHVCNNPSTWKVGAENQELKTSLNYTVKLRPVWATSDPVSIARTRAWGGSLVSNILAAQA